MIAQGLDGRTERDAGIAAAATVGAGRNPADAADLKLASIPGDGPEIDTDMTGQTALNSGSAIDHDASPFKMSISMPIQLLSSAARDPDRPKLRCLRPVEPSIRVPVKPQSPIIADITP